MIISKNEFVKAFSECMSGQMSAEEFAKKALEYMKSPDYNRWKAETEARALKAAREGRTRLFELIEDARKADLPVDYEIVPLEAGYDSIVVKLAGGSVAFPSYFDRTMVEEQWGCFMERQKVNRACGRPDCGTSTAIDEETLTFGRGKLDDYGYWEFPCVACAAAYQEKDPKKGPVWPVTDVTKEPCPRCKGTKLVDVLVIESNGNIVSMPCPKCGGFGYKRKASGRDRLDPAVYNEDPEVIARIRAAGKDAPKQG